jgi:hypothetical protein
MKDGGPVFPVELVVGANGKAGPAHQQFPGISVRDYFAAAAITEAFRPFRNANAVYLPEMYKTCASQAYQIADAMLAVREK